MIGMAPLCQARTLVEATRRRAPPVIAESPEPVPDRCHDHLVNDHEHDHFHDSSAALPQPLGRGTVDGSHLGQVLGAALDQCVTCEETHLALLAECAFTTAHLIEMACAAVVDTLGGLPVDLADTDADRSPVPALFRHAAAAFADGDRPRLSELCSQASAARRHAAARTAAALYTGEVRAARARARATAPR